LYRWVREGLASEYLVGIRNHNLFVTFKDLVSLRIIAAMRANGVKPREIAIAERELRHVFGWEYPFAMAELWTAKPDVFIKVRGILLSASRYMQYAMDFFEEYLQPLHGLSFDLEGFSATWTPHPGVLLNPKIQFGEPCVQGTRVPTQVIWSFYEAGDTVDTLSGMYGLTKKQLEDAIDWERQLEASAA
jgi:uncharacterized protein (DUF433 family)